MSNEPYGNGRPAPTALTVEVRFRYGIRAETNRSSGPQCVGVEESFRSAKERAVRAAATHQNALRELGIHVEVVGWVQRQVDRNQITWEEPEVLEL